MLTIVNGGFMINKKLFIRLIRTSDSTCYVEYSYHYLFPKWIRFTSWMYMLRSWGEVVLPYEQAKQFAQKFKTIQDIEKWNQEQQALKLKYPDPIYANPIIEYIEGV
jgi:hypothetical protein